MDDNLKQFSILTDKDKMQKNMLLYSMYLMIFEQFKCMIIDKVKVFLCDFSLEKGQIKYIESTKYLKIKSFKYKGRTNIFIGALIWHKENDIITPKEYEKIIDIRNKRNDIAHDLLNLLSENRSFDEEFLELIRMFKKIDKWWINNFEIPIAGEEVLDGYDEDGAMSGIWILCEMAINAVFGDNYYKEIIDKIYSDSKIN